MTDSQLYLLDSVGIAVQPGALSDDTLRECNRLIDAANTGPVGKFVILDIAPLFLDLMAHPWVVDACRKTIGAHFRFDHAFGLEQPLAKPNLHGGPLSCEGSCFYWGGNAKGVDLSVGRISVGFALTPQGPDTGGFAFVPGSHKSSFPIHGGTVLSDVFGGSYADSNIVVPRLYPGDAVIFPDCLVHGTAPWTGGYTRRALYYMYSPGYMAWRPYAEISKYLDSARTELQRRLLRPPYVASFTEGDGKVGANRWRSATVEGGQ